MKCTFRQKVLKPCTFMTLQEIQLTVGPTAGGALHSRVHHLDLYTLPKEQVAKYAQEASPPLPLPTCLTAVATAASSLPGHLRAAHPASGDMQHTLYTAVNSLSAALQCCESSIAARKTAASLLKDAPQRPLSSAQPTKLHDIARSSQSLACSILQPTADAAVVWSPCEGLQASAWGLLDHVAKVLAQESGPVSQPWPADSEPLDHVTVDEAALRVHDHHCLFAAAAQVAEVDRIAGVCGLLLPDDALWLYLGAVAAVASVVQARPRSLQAYLSSPEAASLQAQLPQMMASRLQLVLATLCSRANVVELPPGLVKPVVTCIAQCICAWTGQLCAAAGGSGEQPAEVASAAEPAAIAACQLLLNPVAQVRNAALSTLEAAFATLQPPGTANAPPQHVGYQFATSEAAAAEALGRAMAHQVLQGHYDCSALQLVQAHQLLLHISSPSTDAVSSSGSSSSRSAGRTSPVTSPCARRVAQEVVSAALVKFADCVEAVASVAAATDEASFAPRVQSCWLALELLSGVLSVHARGNAQPAAPSSSSSTAPSAQAAVSHPVLPPSQAETLQQLLARLLNALLPSQLEDQRRIALKMGALEYSATPMPIPVLGYQALPVPLLLFESQLKEQDASTSTAGVVFHPASDCTCVPALDPFFTAEDAAACNGALFSKAKTMLISAAVACLRRALPHGLPTAGQGHDALQDALCAVMGCEPLEHGALKDTRKVLIKLCGSHSAYRCVLFTMCSL